MHAGEVPEKMGERMLRLLILFPVGNATQPSHAIGHGSKATGHSSVNGFLAIKSICITFGTRKYIFCTLYFSFGSFPKDSTIKAINSQMETEEYLWLEANGLSHG